jgi:hypothetical protein
VDGIVRIAALLHAHDGHDGSHFGKWGTPGPADSEDSSAVKNLSIADKDPPASKRNMEESKNNKKISQRKDDREKQRGM